MRMLDLFSGIGGFSLAAHWLSWKTTVFVEQNKYCQKVLNKNFPNVPIYDDIRFFNGIENQFDIISAGFPCQDISILGKRVGLKGDKSILFYEVTRLIREIKPKGFCLENVPAIRKYLPDILQEINEIGNYECRWFTVSAGQLGGLHKRERWFLTAKRHDENSNYWKMAYKRYNSQLFKYQYSAKKTIFGNNSTTCFSNNSSESSNKHRIFRKSDGISQRVDTDLMMVDEALAMWDERSTISQDKKYESERLARMRTLGNTVTPQQAYCALKVLNYMLKN